jgi:glycosyltransferase involved in cell wall biosynthesis
LVVLQINTTVNSGSTGRIAEDIGRVLIRDNYKSVIGYGRGSGVSQSELIKIGSNMDMIMHGLETIFFDRHGLGSSSATSQFINQVKAIKPDIIHLHNIHGYFLNYDILFNFLIDYNRPVVWTFHDSWAFTGHCTYFDNINCIKWKTGCFECPKIRKYPASYFLDRSEKNYIQKKISFSKIPNLSIITPSQWLKDIVQQSFLGHFPIHVIPNGINVDQFCDFGDAFSPKIKAGISDKNVLLGVANIWDQRKGFEDFKKLSKIISDNYVIVLIGLSTKQCKNLPKNIIGIERTESIEELAMWYRAAEVFINPTWQDNFPTTNIEALACGTPVITYRTGGSPEAIDSDTGRVIDQGNIYAMWEAVIELSGLDKDLLRSSCRNKALASYNREFRYSDYIELYRKLVN